MERETDRKWAGQDLAADPKDSIGRGADEGGFLRVFWVRQWPRVTTGIGTSFAVPLFPTRATFLRLSRLRMATSTVGSHRKPPRRPRLRRPSASFLSSTASSNSSTRQRHFDISTSPDLAGNCPPESSMDAARACKRPRHSAASPLFQDTMELLHHLLSHS